MKISFCPAVCATLYSLTRPYVVTLELFWVNMFCTFDIYCLFCNLLEILMTSQVLDIVNSVETDHSDLVKSLAY